MLQLRPNCECCNRDLPPESTEARICSLECTFCGPCATEICTGNAQIAAANLSSVRVAPLPSLPPHLAPPSECSSQPDALWCGSEFPCRRTKLWQAESVSRHIYTRQRGSKMHTAIEVLEAQVLQLSTENRARLLDRLILSLDQDKVRDQAWDALAARRDAEIESGQIVAVDGPEALARLRAKHK